MLGIVAHDENHFENGLGYVLHFNAISYMCEHRFHETLIMNRWLIQVFAH